MLALSSTMVAVALNLASFEMGYAEADPALCWQRLRVLHAALEESSSTAPGHLIVRVHRDRERAARLCRNGDHEAGLDLIESSLKDLMKHRGRSSR